MNLKIMNILSAVLIFHTLSNAQYLAKIDNTTKTSQDIKVGAERMELYLPLIKGKNVAIVANQTSMVGKKHLVDTLLSCGVRIKKIFCPEHGFRGESEAGEKVKDGIDLRSGLPIISLYGEKKKPTPEDLKDVEIVIYDIQDVGVRFYTYISTMTYAMEACAEQGKTFLILDRPNPNGHFVDGPVLEKEYASFVGLHPVPIVYGMTVAEYARMVNEEGWLKNGIKCNLKYITCSGYSHNDLYQLPVKPSPNLPNMNAVYLYPTLGLFEGTIVSVGRGTDLPFQIIGHPSLQNADFSFTPKSIPGVAKNPPYEGIECKGHNLSEFALIFIKNYKKLYLFWLIGTYADTPNKDEFFTEYFDKLAGTSKLREQIINGISEEEIRKSWEEGLKKFKQIIKKYLLYEDFE